MPPSSLKAWLGAMVRRPPLRRPEPPQPGPALATVESARRVFGRLTDGRDLAAAARAQAGPRLEENFRRYLEWLEHRGYALGSCDDIPLRFDERRAYLRYDVHIRDLFGAFLLAELHERLHIPGSFQICWEHSRAEA